MRMTVHFDLGLPHVRRAMRLFRRREIRRDRWLGVLCALLDVLALGVTRRTR